MSAIKASDLFVSPQDIFSQSSTQGTDLGARATTGDGRYYRYALASGTAALVVGKLYQAQDEDTQFENLAIAAAAANATSIVTTSTVTVAANHLAGGYAMITVTPGVGYAYKIKSHAAASAAVFTVNLEDSIQVALTTSSKVDLIPSPYSNVIINAATPTCSPIGNAVYPVAINDYGWLQVKGVANILAQGTIAVGTPVGNSLTTAGAITTYGGTTAFVGTALTAISTTEYGSVLMQLE